VIEQASAAARNALPALIWGPSGSGKEFVARAVHAWGERASAPFEVVACDSIPESLQRREIFGCVAGVHPLLPGDYAGAIARAASGTLFLDGIDQLHEDVRKALRDAIASAAFTPDGARVTQAVRARVIATSDLPTVATSIGHGAQHTIEVLALGERREDILPLAAHFLATAADAAGVDAVGFSPDARAYLLSEPWPGNVRELRARVREAVRLTGGGAITAEALLLAADEAELPSFKDAKRAFETRYVMSLLRRCAGNISRAARLAKKDRKDFYDVIRRTGIDPSAFRGV
jgi:two-component system response regulator GlrR